MERSCHVKVDLNSVAAKNLTARASAGRPIDLVTVAGVVKVTECIISGFKHALNDFGIDYGIVRPAEGN